jgi:YbbR domain-containing protein
MFKFFRLLKRKVDLRAMLLCFVAALLFWLLNEMNQKHYADLNYPVQFKYDDAELVSVSEQTHSVRFNANGIGWDLFKIKLGVWNEPIVIEVSTKKKYKYLLTADLGNYIEGHLNNLQVQYFIDDTLHTGLERLKKAKMKLVLDRKTISLEEPYKVIGPIHLNPEYITVSGPEKILDTLTKVVYIDLPFHHISTDIDEEVSIPAPTHPKLKYDATKLQVTFKVGENKKPFEE